MKVLVHFTHDLNSHFLHVTNEFLFEAHISHSILIMKVDFFKLKKMSHWYINGVSGYIMGREGRDGQLLTVGQVRDPHLWKNHGWKIGSP